MISFAEAYDTVMKSAFGTGSETVSFVNTAGRVLTEDLFSNCDMPPFNRSAVDGYACRSEDLSHELEVIEIIAAGKEPLKKPGKYQCSKIMTGAIVPEGCDIVFMVEEAVVLPGGRVKFTGDKKKSNISFRGEDLKSGDLLLHSGRLVAPPDIAILASFGLVEVLVRKKPAVAIISTGDELVEPEKKPDRSQIRNSNAYQLAAQVQRAGGTPFYYGIVPDNDSAFAVIDKAIRENDVIILTGGVSMGDYDLVPAFLSKAGVKILFDRVNVQPGKPTTFGVHSKALVFGLPGNPVSSYIQFETLVRPLIQKMMDSQWEPAEIDIMLGEKYERKSSSRMGWIPVKINEHSEAIPVRYNGSAHIAALSYSDGIISIMPGIDKLEKGAIVRFRPI
jgi:molybdopterin molybdotransferase